MKIIRILFLLAIIFPTTNAMSQRAFYKKRANASSVIIKSPQYTKGGTFFTSFYDATKRSTLTFVTEEGGIRILAENNPDAATNRALEIISELSLKDKVSTENKMSTTSTIVPS